MKDKNGNRILIIAITEAILKQQSFDLVKSEDLSFNDTPVVKVNKEAKIFEINKEHFLEGSKSSSNSHPFEKFIKHRKSRKK